MPVGTWPYGTGPYGGPASELSPYQLWFNGLLMGDGTPYDLVSAEGLDTLPGINQNDVDRERDEGQFPGQYFATGREIVLTFDVTDATDAAFRADVETLGAATIPLPAQELPLQWVLPGMPQTARQVNCRVVGRKLPLDYPYTRRFSECVLRLWATDPRIYDATLQQASTGLPIANAGVTWPAVWPIVWATSSSPTGLVSCTNAGNWPSRPQIVIQGPVDNPVVQNLATGQYQGFTGTLQATDTLTIDMLQKTALFNGSGSWRGKWTAGSSWWELAPGTTQVHYSANTAQTGSTMTISWRSTWM